MCFYHSVFYCWCQILKNWSLKYAAAIKYQLVAEYHLNLLKCDSSGAKFIHKACAGPGIIAQGKKMQTPMGRVGLLNSVRIVNSCLYWIQKDDAVPFLHLCFFLSGQGSRLLNM